MSNLFTFLVIFSSALLVAFIAIVVKIKLGNKFVISVVDVIENDQDLLNTLRPKPIIRTNKNNKRENSQQKEQEKIKVQDIDISVGHFAAKSSAKVVGVAEVEEVVVGKHTEAEAGRFVQKVQGLDKQTLVNKGIHSAMESDKRRNRGGQGQVRSM